MNGTKIAISIEALLSDAVIDLGMSDWLVIDQAQIDTFSAVTFDPDLMHIDPDWASANSPYGTTIVFGFQTLSLLSHFSHQIFEAIGITFSGGHALNYGFNRVRFIAPVRVDKRIRAHIVKTDVSHERPGQSLFTFDVTIEIEGELRPALSAQWLWLWVPKPSLMQKNQNNSGEELL